MGAHGQDHGVGGGDLRAVHADDDVALLDARRLGRAALGHVGHISALAHGELVDLGVLGVDGLHAEPDVGVRHGLALDDLVGDLGGVVARDGETDAGEALGVGAVQRADAHELALGVDERAAGVARVDGGVDLDQVGVERVARGALEELVAREGRDDALRDGLLEAEGAAHRHDPVADLQRRGVPDLHRGDAGALEVDLDHSDVGGGVGAHEGRVVALSVDGHGDALGVLDHVVVGDDVAVRVVDDAGAQALAVARGHVDGHDGGQGLRGHGRGGRGALVVRVDGDGLVDARVEGGGAGLADDAGGKKRPREQARAEDAARHAQDQGLGAAVLALGLGVGAAGRGGRGNVAGLGRVSGLLAGDRRHGARTPRRATGVRGAVAGVNARLLSRLTCMETRLVAHLGTTLIAVLIAGLGRGLRRALLRGLGALGVVRVLAHLYSPPGRGAPDKDAHSSNQEALYPTGLTVNLNTPAAHQRHEALT